MKKLTIGSAVYDDYEGVYFTYQALAMNHKDLQEELDYVIIDNNPDSKQGKLTKQLCESTKGRIRYFPYVDKVSNSIKNQVFQKAQGEFTMVIDCHVLLDPIAIPRLLNFLESRPKSDDLYHGCLLYDHLENENAVTHMEPKWRGGMFGTWANDPRGQDPDGDPFEIIMHGGGLFCARTESWLGFHEGFKGFGAEEGYIHEKYRQRGNKIWCLPFLRWTHRFNRAHPIPYPNIIEERIRNYIIGWQELNLPIDDVINHFSKTNPDIDINNIINRVNNNQVLHAWTESRINFEDTGYFRYIKYDLIDSYDGHGALQACTVTPTPTVTPRVVSFSSQSENARASEFIKSNGSWQSNPDNKKQFPHTITLDFIQPIEMKEIITSSRPGIQLGMPTKFKVYVSNDQEQWHEVSNVDVFKN